MSDATQNGLFDSGTFDVSLFDYIYYIGIDRQICLTSTISKTFDISSTISKEIDLTSTLKKVC